jgi:DNA-binding LacI/PurR family transcriptional regulator
MGERIRTGIRRLVENGRRRIAVQFWDHVGAVADGDAPHAAMIRAGFAACGIAARPGWLVSDLHPLLPGSGHRGFERMWNATSEKPDGLLLCDDHFFPEAALAIVGRRIAVPEELQVVSFANAGHELFSPFPLSTLVIDPDQVADAAAALLQQVMRGEVPIPSHVLAPCTWGRAGPGG